MTPGGFGTPEFGDELTRVRVSGDLLVRETGGPDGYTSAATPIDGASLGEPLTEVTVAFTQPVTLVGPGFEVLSPQGEIT